MRTQFNGLLFVLAVVMTAAAYSAELWRRFGLGAEFSRWQLIWMSAIRPGYLRAAYEQSEKNSDVESAKMAMRQA